MHTVPCVQPHVRGPDVLPHTRSQRPWLPPFCSFLGVTASHWDEQGGAPSTLRTKTGQVSGEQGELVTLPAYAARTPTLAESPQVSELSSPAFPTRLREMKADDGADPRAEDS